MTRVIFLLFCVSYTAAQTTYVVNIGMHIFGGTEQSSLKTAADCLSGCRGDSSCLAADFNDHDDSCFFHDVSTACASLASKASCINFQLMSCSINSGQHILGGTYQPGVTEVSTCFTNCKSNSNTCHAIDFNSADKTCFFHSNTTACESLISKDTCTHLKIKQCSGGTVSSSSHQITIGRHVLGGTFAGTSTLNSCLLACAALSSCMAVDYHAEESACWFHSSSTACSAMVAKSNCTHVRLTSTCE